MKWVKIDSTWFNFCNVQKFEWKPEGFLAVYTSDGHYHIFEDNDQKKYNMVCNKLEVPW